MTFPGNVFPQPEVIWAEAVDRTVGKFDIYLSAKHGHPSASGRRMELSELGLLVVLDGTASAGLHSFNDWVILL